MLWPLCRPFLRLGFSGFGGPLPLMDRIRQARDVQAFLGAVNAAAVGAILGTIVPLAQSAVASLPTGAIALAGLLLLWRYHLDTLYLVLGGAAAGLLLSL
ncbi:MAG: chromate transporter [candidate division NC10 bacterium]|nr:chromate transporter [candidate division NC10 bacterium]MBI4391479.1 chromate transporter [candidate division NC10 bacterium]